MPKLIEYPRTSYTGAWELAEIVDDTGGKCAIETAARKLNRKVSGSFKAIIGSGVKFGLMTSKRDLLTTTTLFKRIKHAYDKNEERQFHREAFLTPPLFTQLCRKFRNRELPVQMLDVMLIREFGVEEINAQSVSKAFVDGCRMCGLIDEQNIIADIDALNTGRSPRRELSSQPQLMQHNSDLNVGNPDKTPQIYQTSKAPGASMASEDHVNLEATEPKQSQEIFPKTVRNNTQLGEPVVGPVRGDAIASLFGLSDGVSTTNHISKNEQLNKAEKVEAEYGFDNKSDFTVQLDSPSMAQTQPFTTSEKANGLEATSGRIYQVQISGPGVNTLLEISDEDDVAIAMAMLDKIKRQLRMNR